LKLTLMPVRCFGGSNQSMFNLIPGVYAFMVVAIRTLIMRLGK
jgi:hypothetical protein